MTDTKREDTFTLQVVELGGLYQFNCSGTAADVVAAFKEWTERIDKRIDANEPTAPGVTGGSGGPGRIASALTIVPPKGRA